MRGSLLIAGGNIGATEEGKKAIIGRFCELCGAQHGKILIVPCASGDPEDSAGYIREEFLKAGIADTVTLPLTENNELLCRGWTDRADESLFPLFEGVSGVWFTGGDQLRTSHLLLKEDGSDTPVLKRIRTVLDQGGAVGGTSAGAAIMSRTMIVRGDDEGVLTLPVCTDIHKYVDTEQTPEALLLGPGLGFLPRGVADQHFNRRPRLQRLLAAMEFSGENQGFGVSEDTALEVNLEKKTMCVHGSAYVMCVLRHGGRTILQKLTAADGAIQY